MDIGNIIAAICVVGGVGLVFGLLLALAAHIFAVKKDERAEKILSVLPGANCGSCGYAGCSAYAEAVVQGGAPVNGCTVGKSAVANQIADIMGVKAGEVKECVARVMCGGDCASVVYKFEYKGIEDCIAAAKFAGGAKKCESGCLGLGHCVSVCPFGAISIKDGVAVVDDELCQACGKC
ncbi:MAG: RnfABCDGE type electron transport complex subunit B, partial [Clostridia bacterium]|nr:RnfABCDGE type electron transport complex subunit B [Clostridia bacterium]